MIVLFSICACITTVLGLPVDGEIHSRYNLSTNGSESEPISDCPPWFYYNSNSNQCECFRHPDITVDVVCTETGALLSFGSCMTYDEAEGTTSVGPCRSFLVHNRNISNRMYIHLPNNVSELNDYMCAPMNRKGLSCSECIDGFGPAVFSYGFQCANCTGAWYGVPVYLFMEFVPITVFFVFVLAFQLSMTKAPMTSFVLYSQIVSLGFGTLATFRASVEYEQGEAAYFLFKLVVAFYGVWNLNFVRFLLPPFCISPNLKQLHIVSLFYISAFYPIIMIAITWTCIELYSRNFRPLVYLWKRISTHSSGNRESKGTIIDVFATFLLLSYTKMMHTSLYILFAHHVLNMNGKPTKAIVGIDTSVEYLSGEHIPFAIFAFLILLGPVLLPVLLLALYPIRSCRKILEKCGLGGRTKAALDTFVEKFYSCYRDGLDGGKDMRSLASLYFLIRISVFLIIAVQSEVLYFFFTALIFCGTSLLIAIVRPYKKSIMNNIDVLVLTALSLLSILYALYLYLVPGYSRFMFIALFITYTLPLVGFFISIIYLGVNKASLVQLFKLAVGKFSSKTNDTIQNLDQENRNIEANSELPDRITHASDYSETHCQLNFVP